MLLQTRRHSWAWSIGGGEQPQRLVLQPQPGGWLPRGPEQLQGWPWGWTAVGCPKGPGCSGWGSCGRRLAALPQVGRIFTGTPGSKGRKDLLHGRRDVLVALFQQGVEERGNVGCWQQKESCYPVGRHAIWRIRAVPWYQMALLGDGASGAAEPKPEAPGHWTCSLLLHPRGGHAMGWGGNRKRQKAHGKERGRGGRCSEGWTCIPPRRLPLTALHNWWMCKSFCLFPNPFKAIRLQSAAQNPCYVFMSELVALTKEAGREGRRCLLKERKGKQAQGPGYGHGRMEI